MRIAIIGMGTAGVSLLKELVKQERFSDYLNNGVFNFHIYFDDIKEFLNGLGINPEFKEYPDEKSLKLYHYLIFREIFK